MNICFKILLAIVFLISSGCTSQNSTNTFGFKIQPLAFIFNTTDQAQNWRKYCKELASQINTEIIAKNYLSNPIYITPSCAEISPCEQINTAFDKVYKDLLASELLALGVPVRNAISKESLVVSYSVSIVDDAQYRYKGGEAVITNSIIKNNNYIFSSSGILEITPKEYSHFFQNNNSSTISVKQRNDLAENKKITNFEDTKLNNSEIHIQPEPLKKGVI